MAGRDVAAARRAARATHRQRLDVAAHHRRGRRPALRSLLERPLHQLAEPARAIRRDLVRRHRGGEQVAFEHHRHLAAGERRAPGDHLVEHHADRVDVGGGGRRLAADLLGSQVLGSAGDHAVGATLAERLGQAEVDQLDEVGAAALALDDHVLRRQVAVDDVAGVGRLEGIEDLRGDAGGARPAEVVAGQHPGQARPAQPLHHQVRMTVDGAHIIEGDHMGMGDPADRLGLAPHPRHRGVAGDVDQLDRDRALEAELHGVVDDAHAAGADEALQLVLAVEDLANPLAGLLEINGTASSRHPAESYRSGEPRIARNARRR
jgi:hypothetical protein